LPSSRRLSASAGAMALGGGCRSFKEKSPRAPTLAQLE
jgi:hypothetical protein